MNETRRTDIILGFPSLSQFRFCPVSEVSSRQPQICFRSSDWLHMLEQPIFSARQHLCYSAVYAIARPSVCLSVTRVDQSKTVEGRIMQLSLQSSPMTLVSSRLTSPRNSKGNIGSGAPNKRGVGKICSFQPISRRISETVQDRT